MSESDIRVLLVEDSQAEAALIREFLSVAHGPRFQVTPVTRVREGVTKLRAGGFDVVVLDLNLPDSRGLEGLRTILDASPGVPVIILTNMNDESLAAEAVRSGAQDYLIKRQVDTQQLTRSIRYAQERQRYKRELRESEERYALALAGASDGIWDWDVARDQVYFSPRWKAMLGFAENEIGDTIDEWFGRVYPEDLTGLKDAMQSHLAGETPHFEQEHRIRNREREYLWVLCRGLAIRDDTGRAYRMAGSMTDVTRRKRVEHQLMHNALHDALTGLANRALYVDRLDLALKSFQRDPGRVFAVVYFDLNRFKNINDSLGHAVGDALLVAVAHRLMNFLRPGDTFARLGGDEFAILLNDLEDLDVVTQVARRVHMLLSQVFHLDGHEIYTSASIGIAISEEKYRRPEEMLRDADLAMYRAKQSGTGCCEIFNQAMHDSAVHRLKLETELQRALERREFVLFYQPIVAVDSGRIMSFETLLRWQHPRHGLILPDQFIQTAEETGIIVPIGWWVLEQACRQTVEWQRLFPLSPPISVSVNISGKVFRHKGMADRLLNILSTHDLTGQSLRIEITETAIMDHREEALDELAHLRRAGVQLYIDDFGTGYSSLSYLQRFAYDTLKIDRSFVSQVSSCRDSEAIVRAIVMLGRMLNMNVVAEGVETSNQLSWLRQVGCPEAQGFLFSQAVNVSGVGKLLEQEAST